MNGIITNQEINNQKEIIITLCESLLSIKSLVALVRENDFIKAIKYFSEHNINLIVAADKDRIGKYLVSANNANAKIIITDTSEEIDLKGLKDYEFEFLKIRFIDDSTIKSAAKMIAKDIPLKLSKEDAIKLARKIIKKEDLISKLTAEIFREVRENEEAIKNMKAISNATIINDIKSIADIIIKRNSGLFVVKTPTGSGKTKFIINNEIKNSKERGDKSVYIAHRRSIINSVLNDIDVQHYQDIAIFEEGKIESLKIVINSTLKFNLKEYLDSCELVIIDEASQVLDHIFNGTVENRLETFKMLSKLISAKKVILCDADANDILINMVRKIREDVEVYEIKPNFSHVTLEINDSNEQVEKIIDAVASNKVLISTDSKRTAIGLGLKIEKVYKNKKILVITSENINEKEQCDFLSNPNLFMKLYDVIIYSPAITSSISIEEIYFQKHFGIFNNILKPTDCMQMLRRDRTATCFNISLNCHFDKIKKRFQSKDLESEQDKNVFLGKLFSYITNEIDKNQLFIRENFFSSFINNAFFEQYKVVIKSNIFYKNLKGKRVYKEIRDLENEDYIDEVLNAEIIDDATNDILKFNCLKGLGKLSEKYKIERYKINKLLNKSNLTRDDIVFWNRGLILDCINNMKILNASEVNFKKMVYKDLLKAERERENIILKKEIFMIIQNTLGVDFTKGGSYYKKDCDNLLTLLSERKEDITHVFGLILKDNFLNSRNSTRVVNKYIYALFNIKPKSIKKRIGEKVVREYYLDPEAVKRMNYILKSVEIDFL